MCNLLIICFLLLLFLLWVKKCFATHLLPREKPGAKKNLLEHLWGKRNDLHIDGTDFTSHRTEDTGSADFARIIEEYASIIVEADVGTVLTADFLLGADDDGFGDSAFLDVTIGDGTLDADDDDVTDRRISAARTSKYPYAEHFASATVVGYIQS